MFKLEDIQIGADPEFFVKKGAMFISGHRFPCGTKAEPLKTDHGAVQVDGTALELNVLPARTKTAFIQNVTNGLNDLNNIVKKFDSECFLVATSVADFMPTYLDSLPPMARELGCNPDYNAWADGNRNPKPDGDLPFRTASGHIHIGWTQDEDTEGVLHDLECQDIVKQLDYTVGLLTLPWDEDNRRRELYGKAGAYRPKPYGVEYRTPSCAWLQTTDRIGQVFDATMFGLKAAAAGVFFENEFKDLAQEIIDGNIRDWGVKFPKLADALNQGHQ